MTTLTTNTLRCEHDVDGVLVFGRANKNITSDIHTDGGPVIGWMIGQVIFWVGLVVIASWILRSCGL
jgi:hypothetical protein